MTGRGVRSLPVVESGCPTPPSPHAAAPLPPSPAPASPCFLAPLHNSHRPCVPTPSACAFTTTVHSPARRCCRRAPPAARPHPHHCPPPHRLPPLGRRSVDAPAACTNRAIAADAAAHAPAAHSPHLPPPRRGATPARPPTSPSALAPPRVRPHPQHHLPPRCASRRPATVRPPLPSTFASLRAPHHPHPQPPQRLRAVARPPSLPSAPHPPRPSLALLSPAEVRLCSPRLVASAAGVTDHTGAAVVVLAGRWVHRGVRVHASRRPCGRTFRCVSRWVVVPAVPRARCCPVPRPPLPFCLQARRL